MPTIMEVYWKFETFLKEQKPELWDIFKGNIQVSPTFELVNYTSKRHYTEEQLKELFTDWSRIKKEAGV